LVGLSLGALAGCQRANEYVPPPPATVTVAQPIRQDVVTYIEETGTTEAVETVNLRARVEGFLEEIKFQDGDDVKAGDILFVIDKKPFLAECKIAEAALKVAEAEAKDAEAKYRRAIPLAQTGAVSQEELVEKAATYEVSRSAIEAARANLAKAELDLSYTDVESPIDGRVSDRLVDRGNFVGRTMTTHLATVISYDPIYANFNISEPELLRILKRGPRREGTQELDKTKIKFYMSLQDETGFPHEGHYDYADLAVESGTGTFRIRGVFPNPEPRVITPGMFVQIRVPTGTLKDALLVPEAALASDQAGRHLMVVNSENKVERRNVEMGIKLQDMQVVTEGLRADDWVIIEGLQRARPGSIVTPERKELEPPAPQEMRLPEAGPDSEADVPAKSEPAAETEVPLPPSGDAS
jgi:RND family efflux transporter MFP subunit